MIEERHLNKGKYTLIGITTFPNSGFNIPALLESNTELGHTLKILLANNKQMNNPEHKPHFGDNFLHTAVCRFCPTLKPIHFCNMKKGNLSAAGSPNH